MKDILPLSLIVLRDLTECLIIKRTSRFSVSVNIDGVEVRAYLSNTGRLKEYLVEGRRGFCIPLERGRVKYRLIAVEDYGHAALIDTKLHEKSFEALIARNMLPWLRGCILHRRSFPLYSSRIDYELRCGDRVTLVELKSAVMRFSDDFAGYPDAPTSRGENTLMRYQNSFQKVVETRT